MAKITLDLFRFDSAVDTEPHRDRVEIDFPETSTVLDALEYAKAEVDGSISFRRSCRSAICGSCSMNINGVDGARLQDADRDGAARRPLGEDRPDAQFRAHEGHGRPHGSVLGQVLAPQALPAAQGPRRGPRARTPRLARGYEEARRRGELRHVRDLLRALSGRQRRSVFRRTGGHRVRLPLHRRRARRQAQRAPRADLATTTSGCARTATPVRTVPSTSNRTTASSTPSARRSKPASPTPPVRVTRWSSPRRSNRPACSTKTK